MMEPSYDDKFSKKLAKFDAFPKVEEGYTKGTESGGMVTTLVALIITYLFFSESLHYFRVNQEYEFLVDPTIQRNMLLNFDLTVSTACNLLNVDIHDASHNSLHLTDKIKLEPTIFELKKAKSLEDNLNQAYNNKAGRVVGLAGKKKVVDLNQLKHRKQSGESPACRIYGTFEVKKLQGNFHITPLGHGHGGHHVDHGLMNFTHRIDTLSFGKHFPKLLNPLDNSYSVAKENMEKHQYFISVVPTTYVNRHSQSVNSNQYSVNDFSTEADPQSGVFPGIFFKYDIEPLMVKITEKKQSLITFLVRLCGIIGGIYVSLGLLHRIALNMVSFSQDKEVKRTISSVYSNEKRI